MPYNTAVMMAKSSMMAQYQSNFGGAVNFMNSKIVLILEQESVSVLGEFQRQIQEAEFVIEEVKVTVVENMVAGVLDGSRYYINNVDVRNIGRDFMDQECWDVME